MPKRKLENSKQRPAPAIRDKIAASKRKGMWMGGKVPLGYDVKDRKLIVSEPEASTVRLISAPRFFELRSGGKPAASSEVAR
ncbi:MAG: hypothetical protein WCC90_11020 [Methylocella sp.]